VIEGGGEPTLHPDFNAVVAGIKKLGLAVGLITNGFLMPYIGMVEDFEWIRVSLDASSRTQYRQLKGVDGFDRVINNLMNIAAEKRKALLGVGYVLTNLNDDLVQFEQLVKFLRKIGASYIHVRPVVDHPELLSTAGIGFLKKYETRDFSVNIAAITDNQEAGNSGLPCLAHSLSTVVTADGGVYLCGRLNQFENWQPLGNLHQRTFNKIWSGQERRDQVRLVSQPEFCLDNCPQCRMTKYNRLLYGADQIRTRNFI
ncbi:MAG: SPASM domain-containing protein, partial [Pseudomonadota bacterium]